MATNFLPEDLAILKTELAKPAYNGMTAAQMLTALTTPSSISNPTPQPTRAKPFGLSDVTPLVVSANLAKMCNLGYAVLYRNSIDACKDPTNAQARLDVAAITQLVFGGGNITNAEKNAIVALTTATELDPTWPATVPGPTPFRTLFGGKTWWTANGTMSVPVLEDVQAALAS